MKIVLIGPGLAPIPPKGWGAVESLVWDYYLNLKERGYEVEIVNTNPGKVIKICLKMKPDIIHIMYDDHICLVPRLKWCPKIIYTNHYAYITSKYLETKYRSYLQTHMRRVLNFSQEITFNCLSPKIKEVFIKYGFPEERINVLHNGAREDVFRFSEECKFPQKTICIGKIELRKRQYVIQGIDGIDFAGNYHNSPFAKKESNYLGEWTKEVLYDQTTNYANLILVSDGEADPLVVKEALMAGLGVVVSECASENLDRERDFIDVIPDNKLNDISYVTEIVRENRRKSVSMRNEIRKYALENFSWKSVIDRYIELLS